MLLAFVGDFFLSLIERYSRKIFAVVCSLCDGSDTLHGSFGDGESKVVRNLTKPPMMNNVLEFISKRFVEV